jgi:hypothetical protein
MQPKSERASLAADDSLVGNRHHAPTTPQAPPWRPRVLTSIEMIAAQGAYEDQLRNQKSRRDFVSKGDSVAKKKGELSPPASSPVSCSRFPSRLRANR